MASIRPYRTAKGERRYAVRYRDQRGRHRAKVFSVVKDAQTFKLDLERRRQAGALYEAPPETFGEVSRAWLERYVIGAAGRVRPRPKTIRVAEDCLRYLAPLEDVALERIRRAHVEDLLASIATHAPRRAEMTLTLLKRILHAAEERGQHVQTKTRAGRRTIDVGPYVLKLLREQRLARSHTAEGYLFPSPEGAPFDGDNFFTRVFKPAARHAGMPELTFHDLRHTGALLMIAAGCHVKVIAEQMGHSDGGTLILRRYGHLYKGAPQQAALALEAHVVGGTKRAGASPEQLGLDLT